MLVGNWHDKSQSVASLSEIANKQIKYPSFAAPWICLYLNINSPLLMDYRVFN